MTRSEAHKALQEYIVEGGVYRVNFIFVFDRETYRKVINLIDILDDGHSDMWKEVSTGFKFAGVTVFGPVKGQFEHYCVIGINHLDGGIFMPNYAKEWMDTLSHEAAHAAQFTLPLNAPHNTWVDMEPLAYLTGWIVQKGLEQLGKYKKVMVTLTPMCTIPGRNNGLWNSLFDGLYHYGDNRRLVNYMVSIGTTAVNSAIRDQVNKQLNHTVHVGNNGWSSVTFLDGKDKP